MRDTGGGTAGEAGVDRTAVHRPDPTAHRGEGVGAVG